MENLAYIYVNEPSVIATSYIDVNDLKEVLEAYFANELDNMEPYLNRLYLEPYQIHPTNSLWGQVDSVSIKGLIDKLTSYHKAALKLYYGQSPELNKSLLYEYYIREETTSSLDSWIGMNFIEALDLISNDLLDIL